MVTSSSGLKSITWALTQEDSGARVENTARQVSENMKCFEVPSEGSEIVSFREEGEGHFKWSQLITG